MTRKLIAFLALLSGLAALSAPVAASYAQPTATCGASQSVAPERGGESAQMRADQHAKSRKRSTGNRARQRNTPPPRSLRAPLLMGIERAHE